MKTARGSRTSAQRRDSKTTTATTSSSKPPSPTIRATSARSAANVRIADERQDRGERRPRERSRYDRDDQVASDQDDDRASRSGRVNGSEDEDAIPLDVLPPAIGADGPASVVPAGEEEEAPRPAPAPARVASAADGDDEVAPAA